MIGEPQRELGPVFRRADHVDVTTMVNERPPGQRQPDTAACLFSGEKQREDFVAICRRDEGSGVANPDHRRSFDALRRHGHRSAGRGRLEGVRDHIEERLDEAVTIGAHDPQLRIQPTASPTGGSVFAGWSGACSGTESCSLLMDRNKIVTATFVVPGGGT